MVWEVIENLDALSNDSVYRDACETDTRLVVPQLQLGDAGETYRSPEKDMKWQPLPTTLRLPSGKAAVASPPVAGTNPSRSKQSWADSLTEQEDTAELDEVLYDSRYDMEKDAQSESELSESEWGQAGGHGDAERDSLSGPDAPTRTTGASSYEMDSVDTTAHL